MPEPTRTLLIAIARRYGLVACVTGRQAAIARRIVSLGTITYVGNHGAEILRGGATEVELDPEVAAWAQRVRDFAARALEDEALRRLRVRGEDKDVIAAFHWRGAPDEEAAERAVRTVAERAEAEGLVTHWGRKVLEVRPPVRLDKGRGVEHLLADAGLDAGGLRRGRPHRPRRLRGAAPPRGGGSPGVGAVPRRALRRDPAGARGRGRPARRRSARRAPGAPGAGGLTRALRRPAQDGRAAQRGLGDAAGRHQRRRREGRRRHDARRVRGGVVGHRRRDRRARRPPRAGHAADRAGARRREVDHEPARAAPRARARQPALAAAALDPGRGRARRVVPPGRRGGDRLRAHLVARAGATRTRRWRRSRTATATTFYVERTSPIRPIRLVRAPGFRREVPMQDAAA